MPQGVGLSQPCSLPEPCQVCVMYLDWLSSASYGACQPAADMRGLQLRRVFFACTGLTVGCVGVGCAAATPLLNGSGRRCNDCKSNDDNVVCITQKVVASACTFCAGVAWSRSLTPKSTQYSEKPLKYKRASCFIALTTAHMHHRRPHVPTCAHQALCLCHKTAF